MLLGVLLLLGEALGAPRAAGCPARAETLPFALDLGADDTWAELLRVGEHVVALLPLHGDEARASGYRFHPETGGFQPLPAGPPLRLRFGGTRHLPEVHGGARYLVAERFTVHDDRPVPDGYRLDVAAGRWLPATPPPTPLEGGAAWLAVGDRHLVWPRARDTSHPRYDGGGLRYDGAADAWSAVTAEGAPAYRETDPVALEGGRVIVWGGGEHVGPRDERQWTVRGDGAVYELAGDRWLATPATGAPSPRGLHRVWDLDGLAVVFGGVSGLRPDVPTLDVAVLDPADLAWRAPRSPYRSMPAPEHGWSRPWPTAWTGRHALLAVPGGPDLVWTPERDLVSALDAPEDLLLPPLVLDPDHVVWLRGGPGRAPEAVVIDLVGLRACRIPVDPDPFLEPSGVELTVYPWAFGFPEGLLLVGRELGSAGPDSRNGGPRVREAGRGVFLRFVP